MGDPWDRPNLNSLYKKYPQQLKDHHPVGRLDYDSSGLLLFSDDGNLTSYLLDPENRVQREYVAVVLGEVSESDELGLKLKRGVKTKEGVVKARLVKSKVIPDSEKVRDCLSVCLCHNCSGFTVQRVTLLFAMY